jgi:hypothetical protein
MMNSYAANHHDNAVGKIINLLSVVSKHARPKAKRVNEVYHEPSYNCIDIHCEDTLQKPFFSLFRSGKGIQFAHLVRQIIFVFFC